MRLDYDHVAALSVIDMSVPMAPEPPYGWILPLLLGCAPGDGVCSTDRIVRMRPILPLGTGLRSWD